MPLRTCAVCGANLPAGATARAKYCSAACRTRAYRSKPQGAPLALVPATQARDEPAPPPEKGSRLEALEAAVVRLDRLLNEADPRSAAPLNKEYRETLRELEAARGEARAAEEGARDRSGRRRGSFSASAV